MKNTIVEQVKQAIREPYAWPGGYPVYVVCSDGAMLCAACAKDNFKKIAEATKKYYSDGWRAVGAAILWEGEEYCGHCGRLLESAYGEE